MTNFLTQRPWTEQKKIAAWGQCKLADGLLGAFGYRIDAFGNLIRLDDFGKQTEYGWEVDHTIPLAIGGQDSLANVRALHWHANRSLGGLLGNALKEHRGLFDLAEDLNALRQRK